MTYGIIGFLLGIVVTIIVEVIIIRHVVKSNEKTAKHQTLNEASRANNGQK